MIELVWDMTEDSLGYCHKNFLRNGSICTRFEKQVKEEKKMGVEYCLHISIKVSAMKKEFKICSNYYWNDQELRSNRCFTKMIQTTVN